MTEKLDAFVTGEEALPVKYVETMQVKEGVECDVYEFSDHHSRDLAIVRVTKGFKTPLQRVLKGRETIEGWLSGSATLSVQAGEDKEIYEFNPDSTISEVIVEVGQIMQWTAHEDLCFYEICTPPYEDGRFENLPE